MTELRLIRYALALGQHRNFARAAMALNITQPTLSRSIAALERLLEVPLFDRSHKGVTPTPYGRVVLERGETVLKSETDLRREIRLLAGLEEGTLTVSAGPYLAETSVAVATARVARAHPRLKIRCTSTDPAEVVRDVLAARIDVGVAAMAGLDKEDRLVVEPLPVQRLYFACRPGHPLTKEVSPSVARALEFPLVTTLLRGAHAALAYSRGTANATSAVDGPLYAYYGDAFRVECPTDSGRTMTLFEVAHEIGRRLAGIFLRGPDGRRPVFGDAAKFQTDPHWRDHVPFYGYFHGDNGAGIGVSHQTGWTGLVAKLLQLFGTLTPQTVLSRGARTAGGLPAPPG